MYSEALAREFDDLDGVACLDVSAVGIPPERTRARCHAQQEGALRGLLTGEARERANRRFAHWRGRVRCSIVGRGQKGGGDRVQ